MATEEELQKKLNKLKFKREIETIGEDRETRKRKLKAEINKLRFKRLKEVGRATAEGLKAGARGLKATGQGLKRVGLALQEADRRSRKEGKIIKKKAKKRMSVSEFANQI